ncbi:MAG: hypothetical protein N3E37_02610 [Candidatus Micrarchaeota archaeon]|nr:hypothetical protein [Candidatus Micrarchaeota archaeon]
MKKELSLFFVLIGLLVVSGCISFTVYQIVDEQGKSRFVQEYDYSSALSGTSVTQEQRTKLYEQLQDSCRNLTRAYPQMTCTVKDSKLMIEFDEKVLSTPIRVQINNESANETVYYLSLEEVPVIGANTTLSGGSTYYLTTVNLLKTNNGSDAEQQLTQMKQFGIKMNYVIKMPGNLTYYEGGRLIDNSTVEFDLIDLMIKKKGITVKSSVLKPQQFDLTLILVGVVLLILVVGVAVFFLTRKKKEESLVQSEPIQQEKKENTG